MVNSNYYMMVRREEGGLGAGEGGTLTFHGSRIGMSG